MPFFHFRQNNSGGELTRTPNLDVHVIIEADNYEVANLRAQAIGIYFDGVNSQIDCDCCGDRWTAAEGLHDCKSDEPEVYGAPVKFDRDIGMDDHSVIVHYDNGFIAYATR